MVSSLDTNNRIATCIVQKRTTEGIKPSIQFGMLTVVSVDNVDILQSNAVVLTLDATGVGWYFCSVHTTTTKIRQVNTARDSCRFS